jgi:quinoprotein dehydrogenase-associated probable ABC transporter substrate-binding protein
VKSPGLLAALALMVAMPSPARELRVCADPNNLPYSNRAGEGFENRIVELLARDLGATVHYTWWAQRRGAIRNTLGAGACDVIPGIASGIEGLATTRPYYRSSYVFVARSEGALADMRSLDDPRLRDALIGIQLMGDDGASTPPAEALAARGMLSNVRGFMVYGNYEDNAPQASVVDAVARGDIDVAVAWGPTAGYFALHEPVPITVTGITPWLDGPLRPMVFDISMAVRKDDRALRRELDRALERKAASIARVLAEYGVPDAL